MLKIIYFLTRSINYFSLFFKGNLHSYNKFGFELFEVVTKSHILLEKVKITFTSCKN